MKIKAFILSLLFFLLTFLSGCYDLKEIDETAYIVALGIDKGKDKNFSYTFQFTSPLAIMAQGSSEENPEESSDSKKSETSSVYTMTIDAPDFYIAKNITNNFLSKNVDMSHLKLIVFSAKVDEKGITKHSQLLLREREVRPHTAIAIAADTAASYLENVNPELESNTSKYYELMSLRSNNVYAPSKKLHDFVDEITTQNSDTTLPVAISGSDLEKYPHDNNVSKWVSSQNFGMTSANSILCGMALFKNGDLSGVMDGDSAMIFNLLTHSIENCVISIEDKNNPLEVISFRIISSRPAVYNIDLSKNQITVSQTYEITFLGSHLPTGYSSHQALGDYAEEVISARISDFLIDISRKNSVDILNIRNQLRKSFPIWDEWNSFDWDSFYKNAEFVVNIKTV